MRDLIILVGVGCSMLFYTGCRGGHTSDPKTMSIMINSKTNASSSILAEHATNKVTTTKMITESRAKELAQTEFTRNGLRLEEYDVSITVDGKKNRWLVSFDRKGKYRLPGGKHLVTVSMNGGQTIFMRGE